MAAKVIPSAKRFLASTRRFYKSFYYCSWCESELCSMEHDSLSSSHYIREGNLFSYHNLSVTMALMFSEMVSTQVSVCAWKQIRFHYNQRYCSLRCFMEKSGAGCFGYILIKPRYTLRSYELIEKPLKPSLAQKFEVINVARFGMISENHFKH
jgi:hypothetical protein